MVEFLRRKLKNGMGVIMEKRDLPLVSLGITNKFGAAFETSEIKGISHLIEHMVFTGTKTRTYEDISREVEKKGGVINAFTANEVTSYWFKLPSEHLFSGLDILIDMLNNSIFNSEKFEKEKKVILEELKMNKDDPRRHVLELLVKQLYEGPFGDPVAGSAETVSSLKRDFVYEYFKRVYNPLNYVVTIVGNADFDKVCEHLEKNFAAGKSDLKIKKIKLRNGDIVEERSDLDQANFVLGFHAPLPDNDERYVLEVLDAYIANGMSSKLFLKIREEKGLAYAVKSNMNLEKSYAYYEIYVGTTKEALPEVKKIILEEFSKVEGEMSEKDLKEAKERAIGLRKVNSEESSDVMVELMMHELSGKAEEYYEYEKKINAVELSDVKRLSREITKEYSTAAVVPK